MVNSVLLNCSGEESLLCVHRSHLSKPKRTCIQNFTFSLLLIAMLDNIWKREIQTSDRTEWFSVINFMHFWPLKAYSDAKVFSKCLFCTWARFIATLLWLAIDGTLMKWPNTVICFCGSSPCFLHQGVCSAKGTRACERTREHFLWERAEGAEGV